MIYIIVIIFVIAYLLNELYKRVAKLEKKGDKKLTSGGNEPFSWSFNVDVQLAVITNPVFGKLSGIKSAENGKNTSQWTEKENRLWQKKWREVITKKSHFFLTYLSKEDAFFSKTSDGNPGFNFSNGNKDIYSDTIIEEDVDNISGDSLSIGVRDRYLQIDEKNVERVLTFYLLETENRKNKYIILGDFPFTQPASSEGVFGFKINYRPGTVYEEKENPFGNVPGWTKGYDFVEYEKGSLKITHVEQ